MPQSQRVSQFVQRDTEQVGIDPDAITAFAERPADLFGRLTERCLLTPHAGEFKRLFGTSPVLETEMVRKLLGVPAPALSIME